MDTKIALKPIFLTLVGTLFAATAFAQWQWVDKDGHKVYSDRSPPPDILEKNILKRPGGRVAAPAAAVETSDAAAAKPPAPAANVPKLSGKDKELEAKKKQVEQEETAKKKADEEKNAAAKAETCDRAKKGLSTFQSGVRVATLNAKGEREFMDDAARAAEVKRLQGVADSSCS